MRTTRFLSLLAASALALGAASLATADDHKKDAAAVGIGKPAPAFTLPTADGKSVSLSDFKGKTVVIEWFSPYCPWSGLASDNSYWSTGQAKKTIEAIRAADAEAVYLCINSTKDGYDSKDTATNGKDSLAAVQGSPVPMLMDPAGDVGRAYGAKTTPHVFIVDAAGNIAYIGAPVSKDGKTMHAVEAVKALKAGSKPSPAETKNFGCGVKYAGSGKA
jgi:peroxiredoxin